MTTDGKEVVVLPCGYLDIENTAKFLGKSKATLAMWRSQGRPPTFYKPTPKRVLYKLSDLKEFISSQPVRPKGRRSGQARRTTMIAFRTTPDMNKQLAQIAEAECRTKSEQIEFYIQEGLSRDMVIDGLGMSPREIALSQMENDIQHQENLDKLTRDRHASV